MTDSFHVAFVCVQNAGRSQMSTAFAEQAVEDRNLEGRVVVHTGGTDPADHVHEEVVTVMDEIGVDLSDREPREIPTAELNDCDLVVTMGCSTLSLEADVEVRDWALSDPDGQDLDAVRAIRDDIRDRVSDVFDDIEARLESTA